MIFCISLQDTLNMFLLIESISMKQDFQNKDIGVYFKIKAEGHHKKVNYPNLTYHNHLLAQPENKEPIFFSFLASMNK